MNNWIFYPWINFI